MELLEKLATVARRQHEEAGLPAWLVQDIVALAQAGPCEHELLELLLGQVEAYDSYAGAGCFGESVSATTIQGTLDRLRGNR